MILSETDGNSLVKIGISIHATSLFAYINSKHTIPLRLLNKLKTLYVQLSPLISLHESLWGVFNVKCMILQVLYEASLYLFSPIMHFLEAIPSSRRRAYWEDLPQIPQATPTKPSCSFFFIANNTGALSHWDFEEIFPVCAPTGRDCFKKMHEWRKNI